jgi:phage baseplate assembly protein W
MTDIFGQDIKIDNSGNIQVTASGEVLLTEGVETGLQDIKIRLETPIGSLFYDIEFGSYLHNFINCENTLSNRLSICSEVKRVINIDSRVVFNSVDCSVKSWNHDSLYLKASFMFKDTKSTNNLIVSIDSDMGVVVKDVNTG